MERNRLPLKPGMLNRKHIAATLQAGLDYPLVSIVAGPGYGKTQAVAQFVKNVKQRVIWLNLTQLDNNSDHFWNTLVSSIGYELPHFSAALLGHEFPATIREFDRHLIEAAGALEFVEDTIFVIDNFSVITEGPVRNFLGTLIRVQLAKLCIFLISTNLIDQEYAETLVGRDCLEVTPDMLRFTRQETELLFRYHGIEVSGAELDKVMEETEGWPLAVFLVCQQCVKSKKTPKGLLTMRLPVLDRLFDNSFFQPYQPCIQQQLVSFAFLPSFALEMVRGAPAEQMGLLAGCVLGNVFIAYDYNSRAFTFHPMYRDFLRRKRFTISDAEMAQSYRAGGDWFSENGRYLEAVECYYRCARYDEMIQAILMLPVSRRDTAATGYLLSYLERLPESYLENSPKSRFCIALLYINRLEVRKAQSMALGIEKQLRTQRANEENRRMLGETYALLGDIGFMMNDDACFGYIKKAAELLVEGSRFHSKECLHIGNNNTLFLPGKQGGLLQKTVQDILDITHYTEQYMHGQNDGLAHLFAAEAAYAVCDTALAKENCHRAIFRAMKADQHDIVCNAYFIQMRCAVFESDHGGVKQVLQTLAAYCAKHDLDVLGELHDNARGWLYIRLGLLELVPRWIAEYDNDRYTQQPLAMGRNKIVYAHYLLAKYRYRECIAYLDGMEWIYKEKGLWTVRLHHYIIKAICLANIGAAGKALASLHKAYEMTYANGVMMCFVEYGNRMRALVDLAARQETLNFSPTWMHTIKEKAALYAENIISVKKQQLKEKEDSQPKIRLSKREYEVLSLMVQGKTRGEIAKSLGISVNSVKTHMAGAYSKLGAANKADAIRMAIGMGIQQDSLEA